MPNNDGRSKAFFGVLNFPLYDKRTPAVQFLDTPFNNLGDSFSIYAYILHSLDTKEFTDTKGKLVPQDLVSTDFNILKTPHVHFLLISPNRRRKEAVRKEVGSKLNVPLNCVSLEVCENISASLQYRIHYNQPNKYQYSFADIRCNNESWLLQNFRADESSFTYFLLDEIEACGGNYVRLVQSIGVSYARKYKDIIFSMFKYKRWFK